NQRTLYRVALLADRAMATSGNYRDYFVADGELYAHIIDPRSGFPADSRVASATVIGPSCMTADGLATAMMVLPPLQGLRLIESMEDYDAMILIGERADAQEASDRQDRQQIGDYSPTDYIDPAEGNRAYTVYNTKGMGLYLE
ncbi:MAG: FAD:protein FMN transferase, partial [Leptospiraceae bacterium]|nr:FAD:protein FMN transferase [Leptospiraceae bacterium]